MNSLSPLSSDSINDNELSKYFYRAFCLASAYYIDHNEDSDWQQEKILNFLYKSEDLKKVLSYIQIKTFTINYYFRKMNQHII